MSNNIEHQTPASLNGENSDTPITQISVLRTQQLAVACLIALIVLSLCWELWLAPIRGGGSWLCLKALPLCIPVTGLLKKRLYTFRWLSLWIWLYFTEGVVRTWGDTGMSRLCAALELVFCILLFAACALHVRFRFKNAVNTEHHSVT